jgi:hypothetical protein
MGRNFFGRRTFRLDGKKAPLIDSFGISGTVVAVQTTRPRTGRIVRLLYPQTDSGENVARTGHAKERIPAMTQLSGRLLPIAAALLLFGASQARAEYMNWSYHWSISPGPVLSSGTGGVALALNPDGAGASTIPAASVTTTSAATTTPDNFNAGYDLTLALKDNQTNVTDNLTYHGTIKGTLTSTGSELTNTFSEPTTQQVFISGHTYIVTIAPTFVALGAPGATATLISANVSVLDGQGGVPVVQSVPEPSTMLLAGLAMSSLLGASAWRSRALRALRPA